MKERKEYPAAPYPCHGYPNGVALDRTGYRNVGCPVCGRRYLFRYDKRTFVPALAAGDEGAMLEGIYRILSTGDDVKLRKRSDGRILVLREEAHREFVSQSGIEK